jgi:1,4-dihydroxy-6-naphthoate synthase
MTATRQEVLIRVGHSPDPDDAFMFHALANDKIETGDYRFVHELVDIETLNRRAFTGELELTAVSLHGYAYLTDRYAICSCGASMGDGYGPMVVAKKPMTREELAGKTIAIPGTLTTANLALRMWLKDRRPIEHQVKGVTLPTPKTPATGLTSPDSVQPKYQVAEFDRILDLVEAGEVDAGLIIHEGQLTYQNQGLHLIRDLGAWWMDDTGLPLPLGGNAIRKDLGRQGMEEVTALLKQSIEYGLQHRGEALGHALQYGRDLDRSQADKFVGMYVNDWTIDFGDRGRKAVAALLERGYQEGLIPNPVKLEFVG